MNNKLIGRGHLIIAVPFILFLGLLFGIMYAFNDLNTELEMGLLFLISFLFSIFIGVISYIKIKKMWIYWAFSRSNDPGALLHLAQSQLLIKKDETLDSLVEKHQIRIVTNTEVIKEELPKELNIFYSKSFNGFFLLVFGVCSMGWLYFLNETGYEPLKILGLIILIVPGVFYGVRVFSSTPVICMNDSRIKVKSRTIYWSEVLGWEVKKPSSSSSSLFLYIRTKKMKHKVDVSFLSIRSYEVESYLMRYIENAETKRD